MHIRKAGMGRAASAFFAGFCMFCVTVAATHSGEAAEPRNKQKKPRPSVVTAPPKPSVATQIVPGAINYGKHERGDGAHFRLKKRIDPKFEDWFGKDFKHSHGKERGEP
jgi:hypothetical protein